MTTPSFVPSRPSVPSAPKRPSLTPLRSASKWFTIPAAILVVGVGGGIVLGSPTYKRQNKNPERDREHSALMDSYGHRDSLEDLQKACEHYGSR